MVLDLYFRRRPEDRQRGDPITPCTPSNPTPTTMEVHVHITCVMCAPNSGNTIKSGPPYSSCMRADLPIVAT